MGCEMLTCHFSEKKERLPSVWEWGNARFQHWLAQKHGPYAGPRKPRRSPLDWSTRYLRERWDAGERNGTVLWSEPLFDKQH